MNIPISIIIVLMIVFNNNLGASKAELGKSRFLKIAAVHIWILRIHNEMLSSLFRLFVISDKFAVKDWYAYFHIYKHFITCFHKSWIYETNFVKWFRRFTDSKFLNFPQFFSAWAVGKESRLFIYPK